ncbi:hypothetical protein [Geobacter sulfurreducens]|nr:hypothetical protein [Geobacter sulfurreducens]
MVTPFYSGWSHATAGAVPGTLKRWSEHRTQIVAFLHGTGVEESYA